MVALTRFDPAPSCLDRRLAGTYSASGNSFSIVFSGASISAVVGIGQGWCEACMAAQRLVALLVAPGSHETHFMLVFAWCDKTRRRQLPAVEKMRSLTDRRPKQRPTPPPSCSTYNYAFSVTSGQAPVPAVSPPGLPAGSGGGVRVASYSSASAACNAVLSGALSSPCVTGGLYVMCAPRRAFESSCLRAPPRSDAGTVPASLLPGENV